MSSESIKKVVKEKYGAVARQADSCCAPQVSCCGDAAVVDQISQKIGYTQEELTAVPEGANLGLGCGNPTAIASLKTGDTVVDLGSGAGFDAFLAARKVGKQGRVIGVDMTPDMIERARQNAAKGGYQNVEFRLGEIEELPLDDGCADVLISNCVINLSPDKKRVFQEGFRVLKPGGRAMISDIVVTEELPQEIAASIELLTGCIAGAMVKDRYLELIESAGFERLRVVSEKTFSFELLQNDPAVQAAVAKMRLPAERAEAIARTIVSVQIEAHKPIG